MLVSFIVGQPDVVVRSSPHVGPQPCSFDPSGYVVDVHSGSIFTSGLILASCLSVRVIGAPDVVCCSQHSSSGFSLLSGELLGSVMVPGGLRCQLFWVDAHCLVLQHTSARLSATGTIAYAHSHSVSVVLGRSSGLAVDIRLLVSYDAYACVSVHSVVGSCGDSGDRLLLRLVECCSTSFICLQITSTAASSSAVDSSVDADVSSVSIEGSLCNYKSVIGCNSSALSVCSTSVATTEVPKGAFSVSLVGSVQCWRSSIRTPDLVHLHLLHSLLLGHSLSDLVAIIGSIDVVFGSVDLVLVRA